MIAKTGFFFVISIFVAAKKENKNNELKTKTNL
jgi:hypothetical protein